MSPAQQLKKAFQEALGLEEGFDYESLRYREIEQWDSVAHMQLVAEIESTFDIMMETQDVLDMSSFKIAKEILSKYGIDCSA